jgi:hypothetical protein
MTSMQNLASRPAWPERLVLEWARRPHPERLAWFALAPERRPQQP